MLSYINTLNLVRLGLHHKKQTISITITNKNKKLLFIMLRLNILAGWCKTYSDDKKNIYVLFFNKNLNKQIFTLIKPTKQIFLKLKHLKKITHKFTRNSIYLTTSSGIISINEAIFKKTGGILFFNVK